MNELDLMKNFLADRASEMKLGKRLHAIWWVIKYSWVMDLMTSDLGIACQRLIMNGQFWLQKRSFSMNATLGMVSSLSLSLQLF